MRARWGVVALVIPWLTAAGPPGTGWIEGTVAIGGQKDVWVYVDGDGPVPEIPGTATMAQVGTEFVPDVLVVPKGTVVDFPNRGPELHNVYWVFPGNEGVDLGTYPVGQSAQRTFDEPGEYPVGCHRHASMAATIEVVPNAWYAKVDAKTHRFRIDGVTPGPHTVVAWSPRGGGHQEVQVDEGRGATFELQLTAWSSAERGD